MHDTKPLDISAKPAQDWGVRWRAAPGGQVRCIDLVYCVTGWRNYWRSSSGVNMDLEGFTEVTPILRSGVYALVAKGVVIYVGKSKKMLARVDSHRRAWVDKRKGRAWLTESLGIPAILFDEVHVRPCPLHLLDALETEMINKYKPRYNIQLKTSQKVSAPITINVRGVTLALNAQPQRQIIERRI